MTMSTEEKIRHYKRSISRCNGENSGALDKTRLLHCIQVLYELPVTVLHLETTGIGRTIHALRKIDNGVGHYAKRLTTKWKEMIIECTSSDEEDEEDEPESNSETVKDERTKAKSNTYNKRKYESSSSYEEGSYKKKKISERTDGEEVVQSNNTVVDNPLSDEEEHSKDKDSSLKDKKYCDKVKTEDKNHHSSSNKYKLHESDAIEHTGGVPFATLKPVMEQAKPEQLLSLEHQNPHLIGETEYLWQFHCQKNFRTKERAEMETWREMYRRCFDEREAKLKVLTANIKKSIDKSTPVRTTKFVENIVKPPCKVSRKQAKLGTADLTAKNDPKKKLIYPPVRNSGSSGNSTSIVEKISVPPSPTAKNDTKKTLNSPPVGNSGARGSSANTVKIISVPPPTIARMRQNSAVKKTEAPLMKKVLRTAKGSYKRQQHI